MRVRQSRYTTGQHHNRSHTKNSAHTPMCWLAGSPRRQRRLHGRSMCCWNCWANSTPSMGSGIGPGSNRWRIGCPGACSMTPGVAREHVRVAKVLRRMPTIKDLFRQGRLSYSKVREVTRVVDVVDEHRLVGLALTATASQLARMIAGVRTADGMRI